MDRVRQYIFQHVPKDVWEDAHIGSVLKYLYGNKRLRMNDKQKRMLHEIAESYKDA